MIKSDNPEMTDEAIAYAIEKMKSAGIVDSGDTETMGIGTMADAIVKDFFVWSVSERICHLWSMNKQLLSFQRLESRTRFPVQACPEYVQVSVFVYEIINALLVRPCPFEIDKAPGPIGYARGIGRQGVRVLPGPCGRFSARARRMPRRLARSWMASRRQSAPMGATQMQRPNLWTGRLKRIK